MVERKDIVSRLTQLGYTAEDSDYAQIEYELDQEINYVRNYCNLKDLPEIFDKRIIDSVCAEFLYYKKNSGSLKGFNYESVIKQVKEGDTTVAYAVGQGEDTPENRFDAFVKNLERGRDKWYAPHRRLRW